MTESKYWSRLNMEKNVHKYLFKHLNALKVTILCLFCISVLEVGCTAMWKTNKGTGTPIVALIPQK